MATVKKLKTNVVRKLMKQKGWNQNILARFLGMTKQNVSSLFLRKQGTTDQNMELIAKLFEVKVSEIFE